MRALRSSAKQDACGSSLALVLQTLAADANNRPRPTLLIGFRWRSGGHSRSSLRSPPIGIRSCCFIALRR